MIKAENILKLEDLRAGYAGGGKASGNSIPVAGTCAVTGELIAVTGRNGAGKSTLLRTIAGLLPPLGGRIMLNDKDLLSYRKNDLARMLGYVSTEPVRVPNMTVTDLIMLGRFPYSNWIGTITHEDREIAENALNECSIFNLRYRYLSEISDGERQRAMIARILAQDVRVLLLDEPTAYLDITGRYEILDLLHKITLAGKCVIYSTHDLNIALSRADKIWIMAGSKIEEGSPEDLLLAGRLDALFTSGSLRFNSSDGTFSFNSTLRGNIYVHGSSIQSMWTKKAINRAGFNISPVHCFPEVRVTGNDILKWQLTAPDMAVLSFNTIYDLVSFLKREY